MDCNIDTTDFIDYEEIITSNVKEIIELAIENTTDITDGVVQIGVDDGELYGASFTTNETENPKNRVVEIYRLQQGFDMEECSECLFCESCTDDGKCCNCDQLYDCTVDSLVEDFHLNMDEIIGDTLNIIEEYIL